MMTLYTQTIVYATGYGSRDLFLWFNHVSLHVFSPPPTGITATISIYGLHHNPRFWPNPKVWKSGEDCNHTVPFCIGNGLDTIHPGPVLSLQVFDPSRFAPDSSHHSHAYLPFSGGSILGRKNTQKFKPQIIKAKTKV